MVPFFIYTPGGQIAPGRIDTLMSQMDYAPTLLGLLGMTSPSRFFGHDVRRIDPDDAHALLGTYQKLGHLENNAFAVLGPQETESFYTVDAVANLPPGQGEGEDPGREAISFYQAATYAFKHGLYSALTADEFREALEAGTGAERGL